MYYVMKIIHLVVRFGLLAICLGCVPVPPPTLPPPTVTAAPQAIAPLRPTHTPRAVSIPATVTATPTPRTAPPHTAPPVLFTPQTALNDSTRVGTSAGGRDISAYRFGDGPQALLLVSGIHGGSEANTIDLAEALIDHFRTTPGAVLPGVTVWVIPVMNPDGSAANSRFNAANVDLNRNWACGWSPDAVYNRGAVNPGPAPMSEPETRAVAAFINALQPEAVLFYHSAADGVFAGDCSQRVGEWRSGDLAAVYGSAAGYNYGAAFSAYPVSGTAPSWADGLGIAAADVELSSASDPQFARNLAGVMAAQCWLLANRAADVPACSDS